MWNNNEKYLSEEKFPGMWIQESGCFECIIEKAIEAEPADNNKTEGLILLVRTIKDGRKARVSIYYIDKKGNKLEYVERHTNHLTFLLKVKYEDLKKTEDELGRKRFEMLENKKIGIFLTYKGVSEELNLKTGEIKERETYWLNGFYDAETGRSVKEIMENSKELKAYELWEKNFEIENRIREKKEQEKGTKIIGRYEIKGTEGKKIMEDEDDFPF